MSHNFKYKTIQKIKNDKLQFNIKTKSKWDNNLILQIDISNGNIIGVFKTLIEAQESTGMSVTAISKSLSKKRLSGGYKWEIYPSHLMGPKVQEKIKISTQLQKHTDFFKIGYEKLKLIKEILEL